MAIKKSDLYSSLWASCDELRGGMDASQYKDYVLFMLFIKYVSDKYGDSDDFAPPVNIPKGASFKDMVALKGKDDIGDKINTQIIQPLIDANTRLARSDFPDFNDSNKLGDGAQKVEKLGNLIAIFENPALDFSQNRAENDDILGDAYEYLMRHFASQSGKSKGQFYTPSEVSRIMAKVIGISPANSVAATTVYDPTCGSGSLLLKVAAEAAKNITLEGQEMDVTTAGLARLNMILHDFPTANVLTGNTLSSPKFLDGQQLRTYDYVVANPPFSVKTWSTGLTPSADPYQRFAWGEPPKKQGDYAFLLHIIRSLKSTGKGACILPHGVLFRGNAEAVIRQQLVRFGYLKAIIGLPGNLFYGTGIPACILVLDKENASTRTGIFMIDASKGFIKDGPKNRLREQDIHKIVDAFTKLAEIPHYSRMVPLTEISDPKNDYNLNLPRYIDSTEPEDIQDIEGHLRGGIPVRDLDALSDYWKVIPGVRSALFESAGRAGYTKLKLQAVDVNPTIFGHTEFEAFNESATAVFTDWKQVNTPLLNDFSKGNHPKPLIHSLSEDLLARFKLIPLVNEYDVYQHLMDYWAETMQDDFYLITDAGWKVGAQPREIIQVKNKDGKLTWSEAHDYKKGKRRFKSDLIPAPILIARHFIAERDAIEALETELASIEQQLTEMMEEHSGEDGLLTEVIEGEGDKQKITAKALKTRIKEIGKDLDYADERKTLQDYATLLDQLTDTKIKVKEVLEDLDEKIDAKYPKLSEEEIKTLVVDDKWLTTLAHAVQGELDRVSYSLTGRIRQLSERYGTTLPQLTEESTQLAKRVDMHIEKTGKSRASMQKLISGESRLPGFFEEWKLRTLGDLGATFGGLTGKTKKDFGEGSAHYITFMNVMSNVVIDCNTFDRVKVSPSETQNRVLKGDLLFNGSSETPEEVALCAVLTNEVPNLFLNSFCFGFRLHDTAEVDALFFAYYLRGKIGRELMKSLAQGSTRYNLSKIALLKSPLRIPPIAEQVAIASVLTDIDAELTTLDRLIAKKRDLKQAMLQELLTGTTRLVSQGDYNA